VGQGKDQLVLGTTRKSGRLQNYKTEPMPEYVPLVDIATRGRVIYAALDPISTNNEMMQKIFSIHTLFFGGGGGGE
jgi:hypothetical protein